MKKKQFICLGFDFIFKRIFKVRRSVKKNNKFLCVNFFCHHLNKKAVSRSIGLARQYPSIQ